MSTPVRSTLAARLCLLLSVTCLGLLAIVIVLLIRRPSPSAELLGERAVQDQAVRSLVELGGGIFDSCPDASLGHLLQPHLSARQYAGCTVSTNRFGLRERDYALPKPPGTTRIVLLGDSFVFGSGVRAQDRCGVHLENALQRQVHGAGAVEVLHIAIPSWNLVAECNYVRRHLHLLAPDLVVQFFVPNDLDDVTGARGFGAFATHVPSRPEQGDGVIQISHPRFSLGSPLSSYLLHGLDHESRSRYAEASNHVMRLAHEVEDRGGRYLLILNALDSQAHVRRWLAPELDQARVAHLPMDFYLDQQYRVSESDGHWNAAGHRHVAMFVYATIRARRLLPGLELAPWQEADQVLALFESSVRMRLQQPEARPAPKPRFSALDFTQLDDVAASQIHGGIDRNGSVSPYASIILAVRGGRQLEIEGHHVEEPGMEGSLIEVAADEVPVATVRVEPGRAFHVSEPIPSAVADREFVSIRFAARDFVYGGPDLRGCVIFRLTRVAID